MRTRLLPLRDIMAKAIGESLSHVMDGESSFSNLEACEKAMLGVKIEKKFLHAAGLPSRRTHKHLKLDTVIDGVPLDIKTTIASNWMIPPEVFHHHCLLVKTDIPKRVFSAGLFHAMPKYLNTRPNRDRKVTLNALGRRSIDWLYKNVSFKNR